MIILGITGAIGHGKSTLAEAFLKHESKSVHLESFELIAEVADALHDKLTDTPRAGDYAALNSWLANLPAILKKITNTDPSKVKISILEADIANNPVAYKKLFQHLDNLAKQPELAARPITVENKSLYRPILQWLGGYLAINVAGDIWYKELVRRVRYHGTKGTGLAVISGVRFPADANVIRQSEGLIIKVIRPEAPQPDLTDPTERERESISADITILNDGTLDELSRCAQGVLKDVKSGQSKEVYSASDKNS